MPHAVQIGGYSCQSGWFTEEDAVNALVMLENAGTDRHDISGEMSGFIVKGVPGAVLSSVTEISPYPFAAYMSVTKVTQSVKLLKEGKADLLGIGRAFMKDARCLE